MAKFSAKKPAKPKIRVGKFKTTAQVKAADEKIKAYKAKLAAWNKAKAHHASEQHAVKSGKARVQKTLSGL